MRPLIAIGGVLLLVTGCAMSPGGPPDQSSTEVVQPSPEVTATHEPAQQPVGCPPADAGEIADVGKLRGINAAGGEFTHTAEGLPGEQNRHYLYPGPRLFEYLASRGHCLVRIPFRWERVQHELSGELSAAGMAELQASVTAAADAGLMVLLDLHNYGRYIRLDDVEVTLAEGLTDEHLADVWARLAEAFADESAVVGWGIMNEPNGLTDPPEGPTTWQSASQAAVDAIRATGDDRAVFVAGDQWGGAKGWAVKNGDPWIEDPADNVVYEAHYYFAPDNSGRYEESYAELDADARGRGHVDLLERIEDELGDFVEWLELHEQRGFVGEIGWPSGEDEELWNAAGERAFEVLDAAGIGATYWATGEYWSEDYRLNAYDDEALSPRSQAAVIEKHLAPTVGTP